MGHMLMIWILLGNEIDNKTVINDQMIVKLQYERGQVFPKMMTRFKVHLGMTLSSLEDGLVGNNTMFLRGILTVIFLTLSYHYIRIFN